MHISVTFPQEFEGSMDSIACWLDSSSVPCVSLHYFLSISTASTIVLGNSFNITLEHIENPWVTDTVSHPTIRITSANYREVLFKTSESLSVLPALRFVATTILLTINQDQPWVQNVATMSEFIYATIPFPVPDDFVVRPGDSIPGVSFLPAALHFYKENTQSHFQLIVEKWAKPGNFTIHWHVEGDLSKLKFHIRPFRVCLTDTKSAFILVRHSDSIPEGTTVKDNLVLLERAPATGLSLSFLRLSPVNVSVNFYPEQVTFGPGDLMKSFNIEVASEHYGEVCEFLLVKSGSDSASYHILRNRLIFRVVSRDQFPPRLVNLHKLNVTRTVASYRVESDRPANFYWILALAGSRMPSLHEIRTQNYSESLPDAPKYQTNLQTSERKTEFFVDFTNLRAGTKYNAFLLVVDPRNSTLFLYQRFNLTTFGPFRSAFLTLQFANPPLIPKEKDDLISIFSDRLSIRRDRFRIHEEGKLLNSPAKLQINNTNTYHLVLETDPNDTGNISPRTNLAAIASGIDRTKKTGKLVEFYDPIEIPASTPVWKTIPTLEIIGSCGVGFTKVRLEMPGFVALCLVASEDEPPFALSQQIYRGTDGENHVCSFHSKFESVANQSSFVITSLDSDTRYWAFFSAFSGVASAPDLMADSDVKMVSFRTLTFEKERANIALLEGSVTLGLSLVLIGLI